MEPTTAIIQFIGIVLFSASVPGDPGLHAIMPRIGHVHKNEFHKLPGPKDPENLTRIGSAGVENHVGAILYRSSDELYSGGGWPADGSLANGWKYLALNGEQVRFLANAGNDEPSVPAGLPRTGASHSCTSTAPDNATTLRSDYLPPYRGAIGVIDIPEGTLQSCENRGARVDTRLLLKTKGILVITATKKFEEPKALVLKGEAVVFVANVPPYALFRNIDLTVGEPHWVAYNAMLAQTCAARPAVDAKIGPVATCNLDQLGDAYARAWKNPPFNPQMVDSGCSNSQWP